MTTTDFRVVNARGVVARTFGGLDAEKRARAFAKENVDRLGGLVVQGVTITETARPVYRPRVSPAFDFSIPARA